ncbi:uncharacterized protein LAESUDRAFT_733757 [Laetiporus sulphureus 93-53]|uniref:Uncharacterized protein n=1 Tax=Laetiporus sulphureus 93-53 TaxID=1314785 RepID=A0A165HIH7_9APHY|nr:uncharacterized protein LAESUDRAFT_733757 [Laetiporus sulphureus 93-53]KZT11771.1 hypothetical protein LAESUDRAFT_733757 [Laetiporus sulphureus 93-53]
MERLSKGATIAPIILASDKMHLSRFSGDKTAWPVYLSIGNLDKEIRRAPSSHATILIVEGYRLFHACMASILLSLIEAGNNGVEMDCTDGFIQKVFPILAATMLVTSCQENYCPTCNIQPNR